MSLSHFARAAYHAFTAPKAGPTLYDLCDPLLRGPGGGDPHLRKFYATALANPLLRPVLARAGLPELRDEAVFNGLADALLAARDHAAPDWRAIGEPVARLLDAYPRAHPVRPRAAAHGAVPSAAHVDELIRACAGHLLGTYRREGFLPAYAAFNLAGDPDLRGRDLVTALTGLQARTYKNSTLLFNLARPFILANPGVAGLVNPPWRGLAEPLWEPVQIRHRSAYYDAFYIEALLDYLGSGLASAEEQRQARAAVDEMVHFCLVTSREEVPHPGGEGSVGVVTALAPFPHARLSRFFHGIKSDLGFGLYVPDCDTTACAVSAATQAGAGDPLLDQPLIDFYAGYQVGRTNRHPVTVGINDTLAHEGGVVTWIENLAGDRPYGNDLDPTLNLDVLEATFRNHARWGLAGHPGRLDTVHRILAFQRRLAETGAFADPRSHIYYLPELYCAYVGRLWSAFAAMPAPVREAADPEGTLPVLRDCALAYVRDDLIAGEMNPFDAALALLALARLGADPATFAPALAVLAEDFGEGPGRAPYRAYEWNKMKTPTRILVGGPEVTSAFALQALVHARKALDRAAAPA